MRQLHYGRHSLSGSSGAALATRGWAVALAEVGADVELVVDAGTRRLPCPDGLRCTELAHLGSRKMALPRGLGSRLTMMDVMVVHAGLRPHTAFAARVARRIGKPYVVSSHGIYLEGAMARNKVVKKVAAMGFERTYLRRAAAIHVYFAEEADDLRSMGLAPPLIVAPPGVSVPDGVRWDGGSGGYLLWLGRFDPLQKGLDLLLDAYSSMPPSERPPLRLVGPDWRGHKPKIAASVRARGLAGHVTVEAPVYGAAKWALLSTAAGFVYPSRYEAFGMSVAEAASMGVPTLATPFGLSRLLADGDAVFLADQDPEALGAGIGHLLSDRATEVGAAAARVAAITLSWNKAARSWLRQAGAIVPGLMEDWTS